MDNKIPEKAKTSLESRCIQHGTKLALQVILAVFVIFIAIYYFSVKYIADVTSEMLSTNLNNVVIESNQLESQFIHHLLTDIGNNARLLKREHEAALTEQLAVSPTQLSQISARLTSYGTGFLSEQHDSMLLVKNAQSALTLNQLKQIRVTEDLQTLYRSILELNPVVGQVYFMSTDGVERFYPNRSGLKQLLLTDRVSEPHPFWELVDTTKGSAQKAVWTKIYLDSTGLDWTLSVLVPLYNGEQLNGVFGIDLPLKLLMHHIGQQLSRADKLMMLVDSNDSIVVATDDMYQQLGIIESVRAGSSLTLSSLEDSDLGRQLKQVLSENIAPARLKSDKTDFVYSVTNLPEVNLKLISLRDSNVVAETVESFARARSFMLAIFSLSMLLVVALGLRVILKRLKQFAAELSSPLMQLSEHTGTVASNPAFTEQILLSSEIKEVSALVDNFNIMTSRLANKIKCLQEAEVAKQLIEEKARIYQVMANTDSLTGLNNRKFVDSLFRHEAIRASRNGTPLSIMLLDVDRFKAINDNFGHQTGDLVLKRVATTLKGSLRAVDTVGRWGGEEFLLVCPDTALAAAVDLAEKVRQQIELLHFERGMTVTISIGVAEYQTGERTEKTIGRADESLYLAKRNGRNRIEYCATAPVGGLNE